MDNFSDLLAPQQATLSGFGVVLTVVAVALASTMMIYLLRCYIQENRIRKRIMQRSHQPYGGNVVPAVEAAEIQPPVKTASIVLPPPHRDERNVKVRRRARGPHPWKQAQFHVESPTPQ